VYETGMAEGLKTSLEDHGIAFTQRSEKNCVLKNWSVLSQVGASAHDHGHSAYRGAHWQGDRSRRMPGAVGHCDRRTTNARDNSPQLKVVTARHKKLHSCAPIQRGVLL
jgi:hypothetical protein